jgi:UDP-2,4-diacetamido-2,4,6-trideoxy-beta-L-altropyranose hydrolase
MIFRVAFRVDASLAIGTGHVIRCLTLADEMRTHIKNVEILFICRAHPGHLQGLIEKRGYRVLMLAVGAAEDSGLAHAAWLGDTLLNDAAQTITALDGCKPDWLVVDHYALDRRFEGLLRPHVGHILVIDDLADRPHDGDVILDQNYRPDQAGRYDGLVPKACRQLLGPEYALLRPEFAEARRKLKPRSGDIKRIFIFFGGVDASNETARAVQAFLALGRFDMTADVVVGAGNPQRGEIKALCDAHENMACHVDISDMAARMAAADLAIGASGTATWERCCLGLPSLVISVAENQRAGAEALAGQGLIHYLGSAPDVTSGDILVAVNELMTNSAYYREMSEKCLLTVSPDGAARVLTALLAIGDSGVVDLKK